MIENGAHSKIMGAYFVPTHAYGFGPSFVCYNELLIANRAEVVHVQLFIQ